MNSTLASVLKKLRLSGMSQTIDVRLQEAAANRLDYAEFLELIFQDELTVRDDRLMKRRLKAASFCNLKSLDHFNWDFNPTINRRQIFGLATCDFIRKTRDILFIGPPGIGKTHLAQAIGYQAVKMGFHVYYRSVFDLARDFMEDENLRGQDKILKDYLKPDLLIIDDMGLRQLPRKSGEYLFEVIMRRYETRSTIMTSNRPIEDWGKLVGDIPTAGAILDRFLHHAELITIEGRSYRLKDKAVNQKNQRTEDGNSMQ